MKHTPHPAGTFQHLGLLVMIMTPLLIAACSSGGSIPGSASVKALSLPDRIELTDMESRDTAGLAPHSLGILHAACDEAGGDYSPPAKRTWMDGKDAMDMVNNILGVVKDTGYTDFINQGVYVGMVLQAGESRQIWSGSSATSNTAEQLMKIYIDVTRDTNSSPMIVKVWMEDKAGPGGRPMRIRGTFSVTRGASATYPYGIMFARINGAILDGKGNEGADMFTMAMSVGIDGGDVVIENAGDRKEGDAYGPQSRERMLANIDMTAGNAYVHDIVN